MGSEARAAAAIPTTKDEGGEQSLSRLPDKAGQEQG